MTFSARHLVSQVRIARQLGIAQRRRSVPSANYPHLIESDYAAALVGIVHRLRDSVRQHVDLAQVLRLDDHRARRGASVVERVRAQAEHDVNVDGLADRTARQVSAHQRGEITRQARAALGVDPVFIDAKIAPMIGRFAAENVALVRKLQGGALDDLAALITRAYADGARAEYVAAEIEVRFGVAERHARLIARDQIGKLNGMITEARHLELGIDQYDWQSMRDPRVRPRHRDLDGKRFSYSKPPPDGNPGRPICCRCLPKPVFDSVYAELDALGVPRGPSPVRVPRAPVVRPPHPRARAR